MSQSIPAVRVSHDGPADAGYGPMYHRNPLTGDVALALGYAPRAKDKAYLTVQQFASYGIVQPRVSVAEVLEAIAAIGLEPHRLNAAGQPVYDPIPIRLALSADDSEASARAVWYDDDPVYVNIAGVIRARISTGKIRQLPSNSTLAIEFGVTRTTIQRAIRVLRDEGLVYSQRGSGTFVSRK